MVKNIELYRNDIQTALMKNDLTKLKNCSILVTGANGMIGSCIIDVLNELNITKDANIKIYALVRNKALDRFLTYKDLVVIEQDITNDVKINYHFDYIVNSASNNNPKKFAEEPIETSFINYYGTYNLLKYAVKNNTRRFVFISSGEVYGEPMDNMDSFNEEYIGRINPLDTRSCYPIGKLSAENLCISFSKELKIETLIVRPSHIYGANFIEDDNKASSEFFKRVINNEDIVMKSKGEQIRSYTYVIDCAVGILFALVYGDPSNAYNIVNDNSTLSIADFANKIATFGNQNVTFELPTESEKAGYNKVKRSVLNGNKIRSLGFIPCFEIDEGIKNTLNILK